MPVLYMGIIAPVTEMVVPEMVSKRVEHDGSFILIVYVLHTQGVVISTGVTS